MGLKVAELPEWGRRTKFSETCDGELHEKYITEGCDAARTKSMQRKARKLPEL